MVDPFIEESIRFIIFQHIVHSDKSFSDNCRSDFVRFRTDMPLAESTKKGITMDDVLKTLEDKTIRCSSTALVQSAVAD